MRTDILDSRIFSENRIERNFLSKKKVLQAQHFLFGSLRFIEFDRHPRAQDLRVSDHLHISRNVLSCLTKFFSFSNVRYPCFLKPLHELLDRIPSAVTETTMNSLELSQAVLNLVNTQPSISPFQIWQIEHLFKCFPKQPLVLGMQFSIDLFQLQLNLCEFLVQEGGLKGINDDECQRRRLQKLADV